jgi:hypothetical protein
MIDEKEFRTFVNEFEKALKNISKTKMETADDKDTLHFMDKESKRFLKNNKDIITKLLSLRLNKTVEQFLVNYVWKE